MLQQWRHSFCFSLGIEPGFFSFSKFSTSPSSCWESSVVTPNIHYFQGEHLRACPEGEYMNWINTSGFTHLLLSLLLTHASVIWLTGDGQRCNITTVIAAATFQPNIQNLPMAINNFLTASVTKMTQSVKVDCSACESSYMPTNFTVCTGVK